MLNARSINNKTLHIKDYVVDNKIDILAITETWLKSDDININGIRSPDKRLGLSQWLRSLSVVCLQETHCVSDFECQSWFRSSGFLSVVSPGSNKSRGCIILSRPALSLVKS